MSWFVSTFMFVSDFSLWHCIHSLKYFIKKKEICQKLKKKDLFIWKAEIQEKREGERDLPPTGLLPSSLQWLSLSQGYVPCGAGAHTLRSSSTVFPRPSAAGTGTDTHCSNTGHTRILKVVNFGYWKYEFYFFFWFPTLEKREGRIWLAMLKIGSVSCFMCRLRLLK